MWFLSGSPSEVQKRAIRISHSNHNERSPPLFRTLKILPFDLLCEYKTTVCVNSIVKYNNPFEVLLFYSSSRSLTFGNFNLAPRNNVYGEGLIQFIGIKIWNSLPTELKRSHNAAVKLKKSILEQAATAFFFFGGKHLYLHNYTLVNLVN